MICTYMGDRLPATQQNLIAGRKIVTLYLPIDLIQYISNLTFSETLLKALQDTISLLLEKSAMKGRHQRKQISSLVWGLGVPEQYIDY